MEVVFRPSPNDKALQKKLCHTIFFYLNYDSNTMNHLYDGINEIDFQKISYFKNKESKDQNFNNYSWSFFYHLTTCRISYDTHK